MCVPAGRDLGQLCVLDSHLLHSALPFCWLPGYNMHPTSSAEWALKTPSELEGEAIAMSSVLHQDHIATALKRCGAQLLKAPALCNRTDHSGQHPCRAGMQHPDSPCSRLPHP